MKKLAYSLGVILIAFGINGCAPSKAELAQIKQSCSTKKGFIHHEGECLETKSIEGTKEDIINVIIHGTPGGNGAKDVTSGTYGFAEELANKTGYDTFYYARPNYGKSSKNIWMKRQKETQEVHEDYIQYNARFIKKLMNLNNAKKVNLVAFSGGTTVAINITTLNHNMVNKLILIGGVYDVYQQKVMEVDALGGCKECRKKNMWLSSIGLVPVESVDEFDKNIKPLIIAGDKDKICPKKLSEEYISELKENNIPYKYVLFKQDGKFYNPKNAHKALFFEPKIWKMTVDYIND